jgi:formylglycine-generating enzyme required for sulfatase activity
MAIRIGLAKGLGIENALRGAGCTGQKLGVCLAGVALTLLGCSREARQDATSTTAPALRNSLGMLLLRVEPGKCAIGRAPDSRASSEVQRLEAPRTVEIVAPFLISATETTVRQYRAFCRAMGRPAPGNGPSEVQLTDRQREELPAVNVSWRDAADFCAWLSDRERRRYRLPTQEEWEYACRGAHRSGKDAPPAVGAAEFIWSSTNSQGLLHPVASLRPNSLGAFDMRGNAWEWCSDLVSPDLVGATPFKGCRCAAIRGGSYSNGLRSCDCAAAYSFLPVDHTAPNVGFRVACDAN